MIDNEIPKEVKFLLCGDGEVDEVKNKVDELGIKHRIAHIGWIDGRQKEVFLSKSMINVLPSYNEGLPMTILETMAKGIPNISTSIASIPEVLHNGENGFLITPGDIDALCECLLNLINNEQLRLEFSQKSYDLVNRRFSIDVNIKKLESIYTKLSEYNSLRL